MTEKGGISDSFSRSSNNLLTSNAGWGTILPQIRPLIEAANTDRLHYEQAEREKSRLRSVYAAYYDIVRSLSPSPLELACLLDGKDFCSFPEIRALVSNDTQDAEERIAQIKTVSMSLVPTLSALANRRKEAIFALMQDTSETVSHPTSSVSSAALGQFQLATSIFLCGAPDTPLPGYPLHGLHVFEHTCKSCKPDSGDRTDELAFDAILPRFSEKGKDVVVAILKRLGLDEKSTTSIELEQLDKRFVCMECPVSHESQYIPETDLIGRRAMTWWTLVSASPLLLIAH